MTNHTPGPWGYDHYGEHLSFNGTNTTRPSEYDFRIEFCAEMPEDEREANARLIAKAPEMLAALVKYDKWITDNIIRSKTPTETEKHIREDLRALLLDLGIEGDPNAEHVEGGQ